MSTVSLRIRGPTGVATIKIPSDATYAQLKSQISSETALPIDSLEVRLGFPPKAIPADTSDDVHISELGLRNGDSLVVSAAAGVASISAPAPSAPRAAPSSVPSAAPARKVASAPEASKVDYVEVDGGYLVHRVVPDDNSCLFRAVGLLFEPSRPDPVSYLRQLIADAIRSNPSEWSEAILGRSPDDYCRTILKPNTWGGAIELSILSSAYKTEIASIDVQSGRVDSFGQSNGFDARAFVVYSGIHYDAITFSYARPTSNKAFDPAVDTAGFELTKFDIEDQAKLKAALELVSRLRARHAFTDVANFTLRCEVCKEGIVGEKEAQAHAKATGHVRFGEYS